VAPLTDNYTLVGFNASFRFQHDRVQQAAYALIDGDRRQSVHLSVGRLIQAHSTADEIDGRLIDIVGHLNAGRALIDDVEQRRELARLNLRAGSRRSGPRRTNRRARFRAPGARCSRRCGQGHELMLAPGTAYQQCAHPTGDHDEANAWTEIMLERARTPLEKAEILSARTRQYATIGKMRESIRAAIAGHRARRGAHRGASPTPSPRRWPRSSKLAGRRIPDLIHAPVLSAPSERVAMRPWDGDLSGGVPSGSGDSFPTSCSRPSTSRSATAPGRIGVLLRGPTACRCAERSTIRPDSSTASSRCDERAA
jgi:hypothetical protein